VPVKTTNDLLVLRSDCYELDDDYVLRQVPDEVPFVDLAKPYKLVGGFEELVEEVPSLKDATSLHVEGEWTFGPGVRVVGEATLSGEGGRVEDTVLGDSDAEQG
jgi:UTP--glucose-1-phosphate uridylyltransferase